MFIIVEDAIWKMVKLLIMSSLLKDLPIARFDHASIVPRGLILIYSSSSLSSISSVLSFSFFFQLFSSSLGSLSFPFFFFGFSCPTAFSCFFFFLLLLCCGQPTTERTDANSLCPIHTHINLNFLFTQQSLFHKFMFNPLIS